MFSFLTFSQNLEVYALIVFLLIAQLPLDTIFVNMWYVLFILTLGVLVSGMYGANSRSDVQQQQRLFIGT